MHVAGLPVNCSVSLDAEFQKQKLFFPSLLKWRPILPQCNHTYIGKSVNKMGAHLISLLFTKVEAPLVMEFQGTKK